MKTCIFRITISFLCCLLFGCQARNPQLVGKPKETAANTAVVTPVKTITEPFPTSTTTITPAQTPSPSLSSTPNHLGVQEDCFSMLPSLPQNAHPRGILILDTQSQHQFLNLESGNITEIPKPIRHSDLQVSPDRTKFTYLDVQTNELVVMTTNNEVLQRIPWDTNWITLSRWQNNENLLIVTKELLQSTAPNPPNVLYLVNASTAQIQKLIPDFPDISQAFTLPWLSGHTVYDPTLTRVVYAQSTIERQNYTLWDVLEKRELFTLAGDIREEPVWSPDGSAFIVFTLNDLSLVSRDGAIEHTFDIPKKFDSTSVPPYSGSGLSNFSWSPDGKYVAFWLIKNPYPYPGSVENFTLVILDTSSGEIVDTCIEQGDYLLGLGWSQPQLVWSPEGNKLAVYANHRESEQTWDVMIADVELQNAVKITENLLPAGWIVNMPQFLEGELQ